MTGIANDLGLVLIIMVVLWIGLRFGLGIRLRLETKGARRRRKAMERRLERLSAEADKRILERVVAQQTEKIAKDFERTTRSLENHVREALADTLKKELKAYKQSAEEVKAAAVKTIENSTGIFTSQREEIRQEVKRQVGQVKEALVAEMDSNFTEVLRAYVKAAMRDELDADEQINTILAVLERDKQKIIKDLNDELA